MANLHTITSASSSGRQGGNVVPAHVLIEKRQRRAEVVKMATSTIVGKAGLEEVSRREA